MLNVWVFLLGQSADYLLCFNHAGHDMLSLLFHFLDEWLYKFSANEFFIPRVSAVFCSISIL